MTKVITPDFHFIFETNKYSVPWTLVSLAVTIRINASLLRAYYQEKLVATHERSYLKNKVFTNSKNQEGLLSRKPGARDQDMERVKAVKHLGDGVSQYYESLKVSSRSLRVEISRLLALSTIYGSSDLDKACLELLKDGIIGIDNLERYLRIEKVQIKNPEPLKFNREKLNRVIPPIDLHSYDELIKIQQTKQGDDDGD